MYDLYLKLFYHFARDPVDDLVVRTISSQLKFRAVNGQSFLNWCFDAIMEYFPNWNYPYIIIDGNPQTKNHWFRIRSKIFPENETKPAEPLCLVKNPRCK